MQVTYINAGVLQQVLKMIIAGAKVAGYTVRPGTSDSLYLGSIRQRHDLKTYVGF